MNITQYTNQEAFDKALAKVTEQGCPSRLHQKCMYRDYRGNKCAIGHLISDDELNELAKRGGHTSFEFLSAATIALAMGFSVRLAQDIQLAHDCAQRAFVPFVDEFRRRMATVARIHLLEFPEEEKTS